MIYTGYYATLGRITKEIVPISISRGKPTWFKGESYDSLAPSWDLIMRYKQTQDWSSYVSEYTWDVLMQLDAASVYNELVSISKERDIILLCYEKPTDHCHRHLVAEWFRNNGIACEEYKIGGM